MGKLLQIKGIICHMLCGHPVTVIISVVSSQSVGDWIPQFVLYWEFSYCKICSSGTGASLMLRQRRRAEAQRRNMFSLPLAVLYFQGAWRGNILQGDHNSVNTCSRKSNFVVSFKTSFLLEKNHGFVLKVAAEICANICLSPTDLENSSVIGIFVNFSSAHCLYCILYWMCVCVCVCTRGMCQWERGFPCRNRPAIVPCWPLPSMFRCLVILSAGGLFNSDL